MSRGEGSAFFFDDLVILRVLIVQMLLEKVLFKLLKVFLVLSFGKDIVVLMPAFIRILLLVMVKQDLHACAFGEGTEVRPFEPAVLLVLKCWPGTLKSV